METMLKGTAFRLSGLLRVNCEAELRVTGGIQTLDSRAKFGKETVAGAHRRLK
jgi:hypothetical protein